MSLINTWMDASWFRVTLSFINMFCTNMFCGSTSSFVAKRNQISTCLNALGCLPCWYVPEWSLLACWWRNDTTERGQHRIQKQSKRLRQSLSYQRPREDLQQQTHVISRGQVPCIVGIIIITCTYYCITFYCILMLLSSQFENCPKF